jgi:hypothetical protein
MRWLLYAGQYVLSICTCLAEDHSLLFGHEHVDIELGIDHLAPAASRDLLRSVHGQPIHDAFFHCRPPAPLPSPDLIKSG